MCLSLEPRITSGLLPKKTAMIVSVWMLPIAFSPFPFPLSAKQLLF